MPAQLGSADHWAGLPASEGWEHDGGVPAPTSPIRQLRIWLNQELGLSGSSRSQLVPGAAVVFVLIVTMNTRMSRQQLEVVAANLCELANEIARHRQGAGLSQVEREMLRDGIVMNGDDLQAAVALAVERCVLRVEGQPVQSVSA